MRTPRALALFCAAALAVGSNACAGRASSAQSGTPKSAEQESEEAPATSDGPAASEADPSGDEPATGEAAPAPPMDEAALRARRTDCNALIRAANHEQKFLAGATKQLASKDPDGLDALADALDDSGRRIGAVGVRDPELRRLQRDYSDLFGRGGDVSRRIAAALRTNDQAALDSMKPHLRTFGRDEARVSIRIRNYCSARPASAARGGE